RKEIALFFARYVIERGALFEKAKAYLGEADALAIFQPYDNTPIVAQDTVHDQIELYEEQQRSGLKPVDFICGKFGVERGTVEYATHRQQLQRGKVEAARDTRRRVVIMPYGPQGPAIMQITEDPPEPGQQKKRRRPRRRKRRLTL